MLSVLPLIQVASGLQLVVELCPGSLQSFLKTRMQCVVPSLTSSSPYNGVTCTEKNRLRESSETQDAPCLISLPFVLHCQASLHLDPAEGMWMDLKRFNHPVPLLIGPTGALSMPLEAFTPKLKDMLRSALSKLVSSFDSHRVSFKYPCPEPPDCSGHAAGQQALEATIPRGQGPGLSLGPPLHGNLCPRRPS